MDYSLEFSCSQQLPPFQVIQTTRDEAMECLRVVALEDRLSAMGGLNMIAIDHDEPQRLHMNCLRNFHSIHRHLQMDIGHRTMMRVVDFDYLMMMRHYLLARELMQRRMKEMSIRKHWTTLPLLSFRYLHRYHIDSSTMAMKIVSYHNLM